MQSYGSARRSSRPVDQQECLGVRRILMRSRPQRVACVRMQPALRGGILGVLFATRALVRYPQVHSPDVCAIIAQNQMPDSSGPGQHSGSQRFKGPRFRLECGSRRGTQKSVGTLRTLTGGDFRITAC